MATYGYSSGWCERCGRRCGGDGRCMNCDPWYTSPLVQVGVPVLAGVAAALVLIVSAFGPKPSLTSSSRAPVAEPRVAPAVFGAPNPAFSAFAPSSPNRSGVASAPFYAPPPPSSSMPVAWTPAPEVVASPDRQKWDDLEQLRSLVWSAAAAERSTPSSAPEWHGPVSSSSSAALDAPG